ncbi:DUF5753 domain-containing protein [Plantactinospora sp. CA-294935]|uniref:DUF5753 domain-containing protein n=1 Tax=Plantactinospora sp. CA-294935 TaxID=3240012 RepID=UPI003D8D7BD4
MNRAFLEAMTEAGQTPESLAEQIGVDPKTAARWVTPGRIPQSRHRAKIAGLVGRDVADLWPDVLKRRDPVWFRPWADTEHEAVALRWYEPAWVPGVFQTEAYARATLAGEMLTAEEVDSFVSARLRRQSILTGERPPLVVAVLDEAVIRRLCESPAGLCAEQIARLVECAALPNVEIHVVPVGTGLYPGLGGQFIIAELGDGLRAAYADSQVEAHIVERAEDVATLAGRWERIRSHALPSSASLALIKEAAQHG